MQLLRMIFVTSTVITTGLALVTPTEAATVFFDDFESDLSAWVGKSGGTHNGQIVEDPLNTGNQVLNFTDLNSAGDIFSAVSFSSTSGKYRLSFDYLGLAQPGSVPNDLGGFAGYSFGLPGSHTWLAGTSNFSGAAPILEDDGIWRSYALTFNTPNDVRVMLEDFSGSGGIAGDAYFDNVKLEAVPEPLTILGSVTALSFGAFLKREHSKKQKKR